MATSDSPGSAHSDESVRGESGALVNSIRMMIGFDKPLLTAIALVLSVFSAIFCYSMQTWEAKRVYFTQRCEGFIEQIAFQGYDKAYTQAPLEIKTNCVVVINRQGERQ